MTVIPALDRLSPQRFETPGILEKLATSRKLAELKGVAASIPNQSILINALGMQEAKDRSAIGNIVTTHDECLINNLFTHPYTKIEDLEVSRLTATKYLDALSAGGFVEKRKVGRTNYYINLALHPILTGSAMGGGEA
jgi:Fic family protein